MKYTTTKNRLSAYILSIGIIITFIVGLQSYKNIVTKDQLMFEAISQRTITEIQDRMDTYREVLYSGVGLFKVSNNQITREQWHIFVKELHLSEYYPGIQGLGYSKVLYEQDLEQNIETIKSEGFPNYSIRPLGKRDFYTSIVYLEPFDWRNQRAFGYDMYSNEVRRKAMKRAIETGESSLSGKVKLVQEDGRDEQAGFLLYLPLYEPNVSLQTKEERYKAIQGFIYAAFRADDFVLNGVKNYLESVELKVYDSHRSSKESLLFHSKINEETIEKLKYIKTIELDGRQWVIELTALDSFIRTNHLFYAAAFSSVAFFITLLIFTIFRRQNAILTIKDEALLGVSQGVIVTDKNRKILYTNKAFEKLTGYSSKFMLGKSPNILHGELTNKETIAYIKGKLNTHKPFVCEVLNYKEDGSTFWNRLSITPIFDSNHKLERFIGIQNDITKKREENEEVLFEKNFLQKILDNSNAIIALIDTNGTMVRLNKFGCNFVQYSEKEVASEPFFWKRFLPLEIQDNVIDIIEKAKNGDLKQSFQNAWISASNEERMFEWSNALIKDEEGKMQYVASVGVDISLQKLKEKELNEAKNKAELALKVKSEFLANMSHEIRTPLNGIIGLTNLTLQTPLSETQKDYMIKSMQSSEALLHIINDILDYSKMEASQLKMESIPFKLDEILHQLLNIFMYEAKNKGLELHCNIAPIVNNDLIGDPFRITQVLVNLVGNALKFTQQGSVCIYVNELPIKQQHIQLEFIIEDTGIGIQEDKKEYLFKEFSQLDNSNTRKYGGTGLGLTISKNLARLMHGDITAKNKEGKGATFTFTMEAKVVEVEQTFLVHELKDKSFLIASHDEDMECSIDKMLEQFNLKVTLCQEGACVIEKLKEQMFDYISIDYSILKTQKAEFLQELMTLDARVVKNILLSCEYIDKDELMQIATANQIVVDNILIKPFSTSTLLDTLVVQTKVSQITKTDMSEQFRGEVLLVEDNEINQLVARQNLEKFGLRVTCAYNGAIAVQEAQKKAYDIIFMDLQMPIMDGFEASKRIRKFNKEVPIVALSAAVMSEDIKNTQYAGMNNHLAKPINLDALKSVLQEYVKLDISAVDFNMPKIEVEHIQGIDMQELLNRFQNNKELAYQALCDFINDEKNCFCQMDALRVDSKDFDTIIHNLKGVSGNLSLVDVFKQSSELYACKNEQKKEKLLVQLKRSLHLVCDAITQNIVPKIKNNSQIKYSKEELLEALQRLSEDMNQGSFIENEVLLQILSNIKRYTHLSSADELEDAVARFDYKKAKLILKRIQGALR